MWPICDLTEPTTQLPDLRPAGSEQPGQRLDFDHVADGRACSVGFDIADRRGINTCLGIGSFERPHLALVARRGQSSATAIAGGADPLNDRVDAIAVALGVGQTLENTAATPSLITMPSAPASKGRQRPRGEKACVLLNAR